LEQKKKRKFRPFYNFCYDFVKVTGLPGALLWLRPKLHYPEGKPKKTGPLMVISNHPTWIDPILVQVAFPFRRMNSLATKDLFGTEAKLRFFTLMHCIIVDKENFSLSSFHEVVSRLEEGKLVLIFPEGHVNVDGTAKMDAFKSGAVLMAHRAGAPILPMYIVKRKKWYQRQHIVMGQPVDVAGLLGKMPSMQALNQVNDLLREKEESLKSCFESLPVYEKYKLDT